LNEQIFWIKQVPMPIAFRQARESDVAAMAMIRAREWGTEAFWNERIGRYLAGEHSPQQALPARAAFVAADDDIMLGFVAGHRTRRHGCDGELQWINVVEQRRGQGVAGGLMLTMAGWFAQQEALRVCVNADSENTAARRLYAKYGAQPLNAHWMIWDDIRVIAAPLRTKAP
jgi:GNAT superfamily N-acetyltransferase